MKSTIKQILREEFTKSDAEKDMKRYLDTTEFKNKIEKIVKDRIKNEKELEDKIVEISKNVLTQLYKTLYNKRSIWQSGISNKTN